MNEARKVANQGIVPANPPPEWLTNCQAEDGSPFWKNGVPQLMLPNGGTPDLDELKCQDMRISSYPPVQHIGRVLDRTDVTMADRAEIQVCLEEILTHYRQLV